MEIGKREDNRAFCNGVNNKNKVKNISKRAYFQGKKMMNITVV